MSRVTDAVRADHAALADAHAAGDDHVRPQPAVIADARRALAVEALPCDRPVGIVVAVARRPIRSSRWRACSARRSRPAAARRPSRPCSGSCPAPMRTRALARRGDPHVRLEQHARARSPGAPRAAPRARCRARGQRTNASRRMNSQWMRARFHGSELRSYQRHFCAHSRAWRASSPALRRAAVAAVARLSAAPSGSPARSGRDLRWRRRWPPSAGWRAAR